MHWISYPLLGRSEDKEIGLETPFKLVKSILEGRYRGARAQMSSHQYRRHQEPLQGGPRFTTEGIAGTANTAQPQNCHEVSMKKVNYEVIS